MKKDYVVTNHPEWYRHTSEYTTQLEGGVFPCDKTRKVIKTTKLGVRQETKKRSGSLHISYECLRSGQFTHKGIPCHKINRSEKRGGVAVSLDELSRCPARKASPLERYLKKHGGKAVTWGVLPKDKRLR